VLTLKNVAITILLFLAIALTSWSIIISNFTQATVVQDDPRKPDSFMIGVVATNLNKNGLPALKLITPKMTHYPENNTTDITTPRVTIYRKSPNPWFIDSDFAKAKNGIDEIIFWSNVIIHHPADIDNPNTSLQTETLTIFPEQQIASTDEPVLFKQPSTTIHAIGMLANLDAGTIKLLSQTQGEYVPSS